MFASPCDKIPQLTTINAAKDSKLTLGLWLAAPMSISQDHPHPRALVYREDRPAWEVNTTAILRSSKIETLTMLLLKLVSPAGPFSSLHSQLTIHPTSSIAHCLLLCCWSANSLFSVLLATHSHTQCLPQKRSRLPSLESPRRLNRTLLRQRFPLLPWREPKDKTGCTKDRVLVSQKKKKLCLLKGAVLTYRLLHMSSAPEEMRRETSLLQCLQQPPRPMRIQTPDLVGESWAPETPKGGDQEQDQADKDERAEC